jgi:alkylation response protein AidB-like acyl-CoA dehydrogenase
MDSAVSDDQRLFVDTSIRFIEETCPLTKVRDHGYRDPQFAASYWRKAGELGWFSLLVPEHLGGGSVSGDGITDAALLAYARGKGLQPGPFVATNVAAYALASVGSEEQRAKILPSLISGEGSAAWALPPMVGPDHHLPKLRAEPNGAGYVVCGRAAMVQDADSATWLLVTADTDGRVLQGLVDPAAAGVSITPVDSLDITRRFCEVRLDQVEVSSSAVVGAGGGWDLLHRQLAIASVLTAAETVGAMDRDFDMALQYAKDRIAFGRPIGSFQAVKHLLADTSLMLEMSKAITLGAAENLGSDDSSGLESSSMAKAFVGDCGIDLAQNCHQVFGGISFTWEHDQHLYLRRITTDAALYGDPEWHREQLCQLAGV